MEIQFHYVFLNTRFFRLRLLVVFYLLQLVLLNRLKLIKKKKKFFAFIGDMTSESGIAHECIKYSINKNLPIVFIIEDNGLSVCSDTKKTWSQKIFDFF